VEDDHGGCHALRRRIGAVVTAVSLRGTVCLTVHYGVQVLLFYGVQTLREDSDRAIAMLVVGSLGPSLCSTVVRRCQGHNRCSAPPSLFFCLRHRVARVVTLFLRPCVQRSSQAVTRRSCCTVPGGSGKATSSATCHPTTTSLPSFVKLTMCIPHQRFLCLSLDLECRL
jgi:hypothetical protein